MLHCAALHGCTALPLSWGVLGGVAHVLLPAGPSLSTHAARHPCHACPQYVCKRVCARVLSDLPEGAFTTDEQRSDGMLQHYWVWR